MSDKKNSNIIKSKEREKRDKIKAAMDEICSFLKEKSIEGFVFGAISNDNNMIITSSGTQPILNDYALACSMQNFFNEALSVERLGNIDFYDSEEDD